MRRYVVIKIARKRREFSVEIAINVDVSYYYKIMTSRLVLCIKEIGHSKRRRFFLCCVSVVLKSLKAPPSIKRGRGALP